MPPATASQRPQAVAAARRSRSRSPARTETAAPHGRATPPTTVSPDLGAGDGDPRRRLARAAGLRRAAPRARPRPASLPTSRLARREGIGIEGTGRRDAEVGRARRDPGPGPAASGPVASHAADVIVPPRSELTRSPAAAAQARRGRRRTSRRRCVPISCQPPGMAADRRRSTRPASPTAPAGTLVRGSSRRGTAGKVRSRSCSTRSPGANPQNATVNVGLLVPLDDLVDGTVPLPRDLVEVGAVVPRSGS